MRLSLTDFDLLQRAILELHQLRSAAAFKAALPAVLGKVIPADCCFLLEYDELSPRANRARLVSKTDPESRITPDMARYTEGAFFTHPFSQYLLRTGDLAPLKISDFFNRRQFHNSEVYRRFYKGVESNAFIATALMTPDMRRVGCFNLARRKDFSERDRLLLTLLRPHIMLAQRNAEQWTAWTKANHTNRSGALLTTREAEIARWVAAGKSNPEIALILNSKTRTVEKHMERILEKLGVENRTAAAVLLANGPRKLAARERV